MKKILSVVVAAVFLGFCLGTTVSCSSSSSDDSPANNGDNSGDDSNNGASAGIRLDSAADFTSSASASLSAFLTRTVTTGTCDDLADTSMDDPILADGLDCDNDGGIVAHITPTQYSLAIKRATLVAADIEGEDDLPLDLFEDTGTLAQSEVMNFTEDNSSETLVTVAPEDLSAGTYSGIEVELYYFQMTFPVGGMDRNVRFYMSDDDFDSEGNLGHHQGDITFIGGDGAELGWVDSTWLIDNLDVARTEEQNGAGNDNASNGDAETGHQRGFFGNVDLWDQELFNQGPDQDIFIYVIDFDEDIVIPDPDTITDLTTITATFSTADTFFYEDFPPQNTDEFPGFFPDTGGEAAGGEWAPLMPTASIIVTVTE